MFNIAVIDKTKKISESESRFLSCIELVSEEVTSGFFYFHADWSKEHLSKELEKTLKGQDERIINHFKSTGKYDFNYKFNSDMPRIVYATKDTLNKAYSTLTTEENEYKMYIPDREVIASFSPLVQRASLEQQGLNTTTAMLVLAAAGIEIVLPNASFNIKSSEEINKIKEKLLHERQEYIETIALMADDSLDRLQSGDFNDIYNWARNEASLKILPKAQCLERKLNKLDKSLLKRAGVSFWKEGVPTIGTALANEGGRAALRVMAEESIKVLSTTLSKSIEERKIPEATYSIKLSKALL